MTARSLLITLALDFLMYSGVMVFFQVSSSFLIKVFKGLGEGTEQALAFNIDHTEKSSRLRSHEAGGHVVLSQKSSPKCFRSTLCVFLEV